MLCGFQPPDQGRPGLEAGTMMLMNSPVMTSHCALPATSDPAVQLQEARGRVTEIRARARGLYVSGSPAIQVSTFLAEAFERYLVERFELVLGRYSPAEQECVQTHAALIAVGGTGRGALAPYSDLDLLFLYEAPAATVFKACEEVVVRDCWDSGIKTGQSVRTLSDALERSRCDVQFATSLFEARLLWGSQSLTDKLRGKFLHRVRRGARRGFIEECIKSREEERHQHGATTQQLEPDVKRSLGGLRDLHLIRWVGYAHFGVGDIDALRREGALTKEDARKLAAAHEFLTRIRLELHFGAGRPQEILSREEQVRIARQWGIAGTSGQSPVECFMQQYFQQSMTVAEAAQRFVELNRMPPLWKRAWDAVLTYRVNGNFRVCGTHIDVVQRHLDKVCGSLADVLQFYLSAALYRLHPTARVTDGIRQASGRLQPTGSAEEAALFLGILGAIGNMSGLVRSLYDTHVLDLVVPEITRARGLLQFNMYHSYTVDEHTLRALEVIEGFGSDEGAIGTAYAAVQHKELLHLAVLLHDLGKGFAEDHSDVGARIASDTAARLHLSEHQRDTLVFLVHKHLDMAHMAFRRDISDPALLLNFSREVGSPERLRMLYVLTVADITAVGPGTWTDWKGELLGELFARTMLILSGKQHRFGERERIEEVKRLVHAAMMPLEADELVEAPELSQWMEAQLEAFSPHYLTGTPPARIAADLAVIRRLRPGEIHVEGAVGGETGTTDYRIITDQQYASGCSHRIAGALTAKRLDILSAQISTSLDGIVVDGFRVVDRDYAHAVPPDRIDEIAEVVRQTVRRDVVVADLFQKQRRFSSKRGPGPVPLLPLRVIIDNNSSERSTIIDVFAHDRPGLLYTICRACFELELSVELAKISTHFDQVVDVFYVTDMSGQKIHDEQRLESIRDELEARLVKFENTGYQKFVP